jgi:hypothetical protein
MPLQSNLFRSDQKLQACLLHDSAHVTPGSVGDHVNKIQTALMILDKLDIEPSELQEEAQHHQSELPDSG